MKKAYLKAKNYSNVLLNFMHTVNKIVFSLHNHNLCYNVFRNIFKRKNIMSSANQVISLRVPNELMVKLDNLVKATKRNKADLLLHWVEDGIALEEWQLQELEAGIKEADAGIFASKSEVDKVLTKWL